MLDDSLVAFLLTRPTFDAILEAYFPFQMRFMDLHLCRMIEDRRFHATRSSTYHTFNPILGHIFVSDMILQILTGLHAYPHSRYRC